MTDEVRPERVDATRARGGRLAGRPGQVDEANNDTLVTGTQLAGVTAAVKAKVGAVTVTSVRQDPDGSYDVLATRSGADVMLDVSKDLKTITTNVGGPRG